MKGAEMQDLMYRHRVLPFLEVRGDSWMYLSIEGDSPKPEERAKLLSACARGSFIRVGALPHLEWAVGDSTVRVKATEFVYYAQEDLLGRRRILAIVPANKRGAVGALERMAKVHPAYNEARRRHIDTIHF